MRRRLAPLLLAPLAAPAAPALAAPVTFSLSGTVVAIERGDFSTNPATTPASTPIDALIQVGDAFALTAGYDDAAPAGPSFFGVTSYPGVTVATTVGDVEATAANAAILVTNDAPGFGDEFELRADPEYDDSTVLAADATAAGQPLDYLTFNFTDSTGTLYGSDALPSGPPAAGSYDASLFVYVFYNDDTDVEAAVFVELTAVPEPTVAAAALLLGTVALRRRRRA